MSNILEKAFWSLKPFQGFLLLENAKNIRHNYFCEYHKTRDLLINMFNPKFGELSWKN